jgi:hypothetical protein
MIQYQLEGEKFDPVNKDRIKNFLVLKGRCISLESDDEVLNNFYSLMSDVISSPLNHLITLEVTRDFKLHESLLINSISSNEDELSYLNKGKVDIEGNNQDAEKLSFLVGSLFLDFIVSSYSVFESCLKSIPSPVDMKNKTSSEVIKLMFKDVEGSGGA